MEGDQRLGVERRQKKVLGHEHRGMMLHRLDKHLRLSLFCLGTLWWMEGRCGGHRIQYLINGSPLASTAPPVASLHMTCTYRDPYMYISFIHINNRV